jgi:2-phospho-L-lactate guanylyltransferase
VSNWTVVIPIKGTVAAKSRLGASPELALAIGLDSVAAAVASLDRRGAASSALASRRGDASLQAPVRPELAEGPRVIVVTSPSIASQFEALGAHVVIDAGAGLNSAVAQGVAAAGDGPVAVMLGDVPALGSSELAHALELAEQHPLAFVADADSEGTVLIAARHSADHRPAFGLHSRAAHSAAGYVELDIPADSGLRRDVDTPAQLAALGDRLGPRTRAAL